MRVWTVQSLVVWERLNETGTLAADPVSFYDGHLPWQYEWMACRLQERLPGYNGGKLWWSYCEKPDLRWVRHRHRKGQPHVRIELEVDRALAFPSWAWDEVYYGHLLTRTKREQEVWTTAMEQAVADEDLWPLPEPWRSELEASWLRLFDPDLPVNGWPDNPVTHAYKEAVFETLCLSEVRAVTHFVGSRRW